VGIAARIRAYRIRAGKSQADIAKTLDTNVAWYADLETRDSELAATLTLFKTMELASILGAPLHELFGEPAYTGEPIALMELPEPILAYAKHQGISIEQLEERTGWDLREFLASPVQSAAELPLEFFQAIAALLGINWLALVPDEK
jgi:transcriptional regulator with XRE-family HTH domain